jgi:hypothetical protein
MKPFTTLAVMVFSVVALVHLLRLLFHWQVALNGAILPQWASIVGFIIAAGLAIMVWKEMKK